MSGMSKIETAMLEQGWITVANAADKLGVSRATAYRLVNEDTLKTTMSAGKTYVSIASCREYLGPLASKSMGLSAPQQLTEG